MTIGDLIKTLTDYLDLGKRIATTIPGLVLACGVVLFYANPHDAWTRRSIGQKATKIELTQLDLELDTIEAKQKAISPGTDPETSEKLIEELHRKIAERKPIWSDLSSATSNLLTWSVQDILLFGLLGFAIGTVLDPVNKALFLQAIPELGADTKAG